MTIIQNTQHPKKRPPKCKHYNQIDHPKIRKPHKMRPKCLQQTKENLNDYKRDKLAKQTGKPRINRAISPETPEYTKKTQDLSSNKIQPKCSNTKED